MDLLWEHTLDVDGIRVAASGAQRGDARSESSAGGSSDKERVTVGFRATEVDRLKDAVGKTGRLFDLEGHELLRFEVEKVDVASSVLTGVLKH